MFGQERDIFSKSQDVDRFSFCLRSFAYDLVCPYLDDYFRWRSFILYIADMLRLKFVDEFLLCFCFSFRLFKMGKCIYERWVFIRPVVALCACISFMLLFVVVAERFIFLFSGHV